ncbi:MAG: right-handed parallel beta-helix repeat-containing protein [Terracidiphilus sp.]|nr:right-handed parallel beta-helix repeat-containing protein [Terracidiphilus sp.]
MIGKMIQTPVARASVTLITFLAITFASCFAKTLYVSTEGKSGWSGRLPAPNVDATDGPLPSLAAARDMLRVLRKENHRESYDVVVRGGTYYLTETLIYEPEDSGSPAAPIVYRAYPGERPVISGGQAITGWHKGDDGIWTADYTAPTSQLFVNGNRLERTRSPRNGYLRIEGASSKEDEFVLHYGGDDIKPEWAKSGAEVVVLLAWTEMRRPIIAVNPDRHTAVLGGASRPSTHEDAARYWIENVPGALKDEGEWQQDMQHGTISYKPHKGENVQTSEVVAPHLSQLVFLDGKPESGELVHDIQFRGLSFQHTSWTLPPNGFADSQAAHVADSAFKASGTIRIEISGCTFSSMGGYALHIQKGSRENTVDSNNFYDLGGGGIRIGEERISDKEEGQTKANIITNNEIHDVGLIYPSAVGIWVGQSSGNVLSHNHIHNIPYSGISVGWTWGYGQSAADHNLIEFNHIHDIGGTLSDLGGIYLLGAQPGTIVRNNLIHGIYCFTYGAWGIYLDEGSSNILVTNNVVYNTQIAGFHQHYGRDNIIENNIFAFGKKFQIMRTKAEATRSFTFERNIILSDHGELLGQNWSGCGYRMDRNIYWDIRNMNPLFDGHTWKEWTKAGNDAHSLVTDPGFVSPLSYNFRLNKASPAFKLGFRSIDVSHVGPIQSKGD